VVLGVLLAVGAAVVVVAPEVLDEVLVEDVDAVGAVLAVVPEDGAEVELGDGTVGVATASGLVASQTAQMMTAVPTTTAVPVMTAIRISRGVRMGPRASRCWARRRLLIV
jgi:hypothetical protein